MRTSLFWKLGIIYPVLLALVLVAIDIYAVDALRRDYTQSGFEHLDSLGKLVQSRPPDFTNPLALDDWTKWMDRSGARITTIAADGTVLTDSAEDPKHMENHGGRPEVRDAFASGEGRAVRFSHTVNRDMLYLALRFQPASGAPHGPFIIRVALPLAQINEALYDFRRRLWTASLVILVLAGGISLLISSALVTRVARLKLFSERIAHGDFYPLPVERQGDELTDLGHTLNATAAELDRTFRSLTEERNRSAAILGSMAEGVAVVGPEARVIFVNQAFCSNLGVEAGASEGRPMIEVIRQPELITLVQQVLESGQTAEGEVSVAAASGKTFGVTVAPVAAEGPSAVVVLHDISELRHLERVRRDFVANVSHEFKTPLTAIQGFAETLLGGALDDPQNRRHFVEIIREHALRLARLTDDLLNLSRIEAGKVELELQPVDVSALIAACVETVRVRAEQKAISLGVDCRADLPPVRADGRRLSEVLQNLLENAVQYTPVGGSIAVRASVAASRETDGPRYLTVAVSDTGIGIPQADQHRIFERFYRVDDARSREAGGTGLGLSIARHLAEAHGGFITVESEVGRGSTFRVFLPMA